MNDEQFVIDNYNLIWHVIHKNSHLLISCTEEDLLSYKKTTRTLEIAGNLISLNKVLKCLEKSQNIKQAIFKNMNLDLSQYQEISKELKGISYIK